LSNTAKKNLEKTVTEYQALGVKSQFFVSPVTVARMGQNLERGLGQFANYLWSTLSWLGYGDSFWPVFFKSSVWLVISALLFLATQAGGEGAFYFPSIALTILGLFVLISTWRRRARPSMPIFNKIFRFFIGCSLGVGLLGISIYFYSHNNVSFLLLFQTYGGQIQRLAPSLIFGVLGWAFFFGSNHGDSKLFFGISY
jgi:hypothetical protein